jgi:peptidoglycan hydrolase CwlO-like protein
MESRSEGESRSANHYAFTNTNYAGESRRSESKPIETYGNPDGSKAPRPIKSEAIQKLEQDLKRLQQELANAQEEQRLKNEIEKTKQEIENTRFGRKL